VRRPSRARPAVRNAFSRVTATALQASIALSAVDTSENPYTTASCRAQVVWQGSRRSSCSAAERRAVSGSPAGATLQRVSRPQRRGGAGAVSRRPRGPPPQPAQARGGEECRALQHRLDVQDAAIYAIAAYAGLRRVEARRGAAARALGRFMSDAMTRADTGSLSCRRPRSSCRGSPVSGIEAGSDVGVAMYALTSERGKTCTASVPKERPRSWKRRCLMPAPSARGRSDGAGRNPRGARASW
jgi:hypothetical protein